MSRSAGSFAVVAAVTMMLGCSSKGSAPPPGPSEDASTDSAAPAPGDSGAPPADAGGTVSGDSGTRATACTAPPFVTYTASLSLTNVLGTTKILSGATIGFSTCNGFDLTTDSTGSATAQLTQGIPVSPFITASGVIDAVGAEIPATGDVNEAVTLFDDDLASVIPGLLDGGTQPTIAIGIQIDPAATAPCNVLSGVVLSVTGHPEAIVSYTDPTWPADPTITSAASVGPEVFINGIQGATKVTVTGALASCAVTLVSGSQTGSFQLVPGAITFGYATVKSP